MSGWSGWLYILSLVGVAGLLLAGCAGGGDVQVVDGRESAFEVEAEEGASVADLRVEVDRLGLGAHYEGFGGGDGEPARSGEQAWLAAWCGFRAEDFEMAGRAARRARGHFEASGELRRQVEMLFIEAIAVGDEKIARRAHELSLASKMPLHGELRDVFAGDLPYLYARAIQAGLLDEPVTYTGHRLSRRVLLDIAQAEYRSFGRRESLPYVARAATRRHLEQGALGDAIDQLELAFRLDREAERDAGLRQNLALFARLSETLGFAEAPRAAPPALDTVSIGDLATRADGRRRLADAIEALRNSASDAIRPPPSLVRALRGFAQADSQVLERWSADGWSLAFQSGQLLAEQGHRAEAQRYLQKAVESIEVMRASLPTPALRQRFFADKRNVYMALVDTYVGLDTARRVQSDYRQGLALANALKARGLLDLLDGRISNRLATEAGNLDRATTGSADEPSAQRTADKVLARLTSWSDLADQAQNRPTDFGDLPGGVTGKLDDDTAVLEYLLTPRRSYVWVLRNDGIEMRRLAGREEIEPLVDAFLQTLGPSGRSETHAREHRRLAERLYVELVGPVEDIIKDVDRLVIAPDEKLYELPFEALARPGRQNEPRYLILDRVVSYTPSTAVLARLSKRAPPAPAKRALVVGSPDLDRPAIDLLSVAADLPQAGMGSLAELFPLLPGARAELAAVHTSLEARKLDVDALIGKKAAESWLRNADLTGYGVIHLATHGVSDAEPMEINAQASIVFDEPALLLSRVDDQPDDGVVTLGELIGRKTAAGLVVLSGCTTGRGWQTLGDGAFGLAGALLYTGSHNVIASTWSVADAETTQLMKEVYKAMAAGKAPAAALRVGQIELVKRGATPASWAAFRLIGSI